MAVIDEFRAHSGRVLKDDDSVVNIADILDGYAGRSVEASLTRSTATAAYAAGTVVSVSTSTGSVLTFSDVGEAGSLIMILGSRFLVGASAVPSGMGDFKLHLYNSAPAAIADQVAFAVPSTESSKYLGYLTLSTPEDLGSILFRADPAQNITFPLASSDLYGILQTNSSFTPSASIVKTIQLDVMGV